MIYVTDLWYQSMGVMIYATDRLVRNRIMDCERGEESHLTDVNVGVYELNDKDNGRDLLWTPDVF